ncbi:hypothetical protein CH275_10020 [Rhodococcus sp. 06-235-1A]|uniref:fumarylacetoacetate hydrolase family protein n=1 Tax=Rhodococcus sp. 06-235-1A TaxID=2022508 RepID=UPI000B9B7B57|nr:fumarylacetoacetate hydrolase family protein [Rhodococcus sp. 06-235-1A]OZD06545.1 hypothetical protein CH275_10020 [Rhodococcus sp. 06-235-1A]
MRFVRFGPAGRERPGMMLSSDKAADLSSLVGDVTGEFLGDLPIAELTAAASGSVPVIDLKGIRLGPPITRPSAIYAVGLNYRDHAEETGMDCPTQPIVFAKAPNSVCGSTDDVVLPRTARRGDWEAELGVVIGRTAFELSSLDEAARVIGGYVAANDVSERDLQLGGGGQWLPGKSFPTACPLGPWLATPDEVTDLSALRVHLTVNGETKQDGTTADMIFTVPELVFRLSQYLRFEAGDLIVTGTPAGVGMGRTPPEYLADGDLIELSITHLGTLRNTVRIPAPHPTSGRL